MLINPSPSPACGRRWREASDEGASAASRSCSSPCRPEQSQKQRFAALARPPPPPAFAGPGSPGTFSRRREQGWVGYLRGLGHLTYWKLVRSGTGVAVRVNTGG